MRQVMIDRKYVIESRRYVSEDGKTTFDSWVTSANVIEIKHADQYLVFYPLEGEQERVVWGKGMLFCVLKSSNFKILKWFTKNLPHFPPSKKKGNSQFPY